MSDLDRDDQGRPRNARPRDELGRPLERGAEGVERIPDDLDLDVEETLEEAQRLLDAGRPFHAHEALEAYWKKADADEAPLWQGLAQLAVAITHLERGNPEGAKSVLARSWGLIRDYETDPPYGIDIAGLVAWANHLLTRLELGQATGAVPVPELRVP